MESLKGMPGFSLRRERLRLCVGTLLACAIGAGLSLAAFYGDRGVEGWILYALGVSLTSFLTAYLLAGYRHAVSVEKLVARRTEELAAANERLERLGRLKDEFVAQVSHELRTPMAIIREGISQIVDGISGPPTPKQQELLSLTLRNIDRLGALIEDLLDVAQIEAGRMPLSKEIFDLAELAQEVCATFRDRARERGLALKPRLPRGGVPVYADRERMAQVLTNLLGNALKFTRQGSIELSVERNGAEVRCAVSDTGRGIPAESVSRLFEKFQPFHAEDEKGTGLGLAICKSIVELHGGRIWAESRVNHGSRFIFSLPLPRSELRNAA